MDFETRDDGGLDGRFEDSFGAIGAELAAARTERGMQLNELAQHLRISKTNLKHLEAGEFDSLPGSTYVSGYIRSVAREVGLDPEVMTQRYRALLGNVEARPTYQFPVDRQQPQRSGAMIASIMVIFAVGGYGGWYALGKPDLTAGLFGGDTLESAALPQIETTVTEPDNLVADGAGEIAVAVDDTQTAGGDNDASAISLAGDIMPDVDGLNSLVADAVTAPSADMAALAGAGDDPQSTDKPATDMPVTDMAASEPVATEPLTTEPLGMERAATDAAANDAASASSSGDQPVELAETGTQAGQAAPGTDSAAASGAQDLRVADGADALSSVEADTPAPGTGVAFARQRLPELEITVRATGVSWVEIIRNDGEEVMARLMRKGETYVVDTRDKLYLSTGNAGGLELLFHDGLVQPIGESGEILRDMPLDAERLRNQL